MATISVAVPVYNGEAYLAEALACLEGQSFADFEVTVFDNASTDGTRAIVEGFVARDPRFRLVVQPENIGMMPNFLAGLNAARSEFFMWRAFDDLSDPRYLEVLHAALVANPEAALATARVRLVNMDGSNERLFGFPELSGGGLRDTCRLLFQSHAGWFYGLWRRSAIEASFCHVMRECPHTWGNDHLTLLPVLFQQSVVHAPDALFHERLKKFAGGPKSVQRASFADMRKTRRDFGACYKSLLAEFGPREAWNRWALLAAMPLYREKRSYRLEQLARALWRGSR